jgi:hypothetical protein
MTYALFNLVRPSDTPGYWQSAFFLLRSLTLKRWEP